MAWTKNNAPKPGPHAAASKIILKPPRVLQEKELRPAIYRPGSHVLREIRKLQRSTEILIPNTALRIVVCDVTDYVRPGTRFRAEEIDALQAAAESYLIKLL